MKNVGVSGTTQYEAMVQAAVRRLSETAPPLDVAEIAAEVGVPRQIALGLFPDGGALLTAVGANATVRLVDFLGRRVVEEGGDDPVAQYRAICLGYLDWAIENSAAFEVLNNRTMFMQTSNGPIGRYNRSVRDLMNAMLVRARDTNRLREGVDLAETGLTTRALAHGMAMLVVHRLARYWTDDNDMTAAARRNINYYLDSLFLPDPSDQPIRSEA